MKPDFPYHDLFKDTEIAFVELSDYLDQLVELNIGVELRRSIKNNIITLCDATKALMFNINDYASHQIHAKIVNELQRLAEDAMVLLEQYDAEEGDPE